MTPEEHDALMSLVSGNPGTKGFEITDTNNRVANTVIPKLNSLSTSGGTVPALGQLQTDLAAVRAIVEKIENALKGA